MKDDNDCPANVKVVNWEETEEQDTEELHPLLFTTFFVTRERNMWNHQRCNRYRILAGTCLFENFEVELKRHATPLEVVPDNETFRFGPGVVKKSSIAVIFPVAVGRNVSFLRARFLDEEVPLLISMGVAKRLGSVIDVAQRTIEFRNFQNARVPLEVVAGHLTVDVQREHASALQTQLTTQMWERSQGQEAAILRPSSEELGVDSSSIIHHVAMTATPPQDSCHHPTDTAHVQTDVSSRHFQSSGLLNHLAYGVYGRFRAGELLPVRRWRRRPVDALAHRMRHEGDFSIMVSGSPDPRERTTRSKVRRLEVSNRQQTNHFWQP